MKVIYIFAILIIYLEMLFKGVILESASIIDKLTTLLFSVPILLVFNLCCNIFKEKISKIFLIIINLMLTLYFIIQSVFYDLFGIPFSFSTFELAGDALGFTEIIKDIIWQNLLTIILLSVPMILIIIFRKNIIFEKYGKKKIVINIASIILSIFILIGVIQIDRNDTYSSYNLIYNINAQEKNIEKFGLITSTGIDLQRTILGFEEKDTSFVYEYINNLEQVRENSYTGYFENKNLIFILAENFVSDYGTYFAAEKRFVPKENINIKQSYIDNINESIANKFIMSKLFLKYKIYENFNNK